MQLQDLAFNIGLNGKINFFSETTNMIEPKLYRNDPFQNFHFFVLIKDPRWPPSKDKFKIGPIGRIFKHYTHQKPLNHLTANVVGMFLG